MATVQTQVLGSQTSRGHQPNLRNSFIEFHRKRDFECQSVKTESGSLSTGGDSQVFDNSAGATDFSIHTAITMGANHAIIFTGGSEVAAGGTDALGITLNLSGAAARNLTMPTGTAVVASLLAATPSIVTANGLKIRMRITNSSVVATEILTVVADASGPNTGGTLAIHVGANSEFILEITSATTYNLYRIK